MRGWLSAGILALLWGSAGCGVFSEPVTALGPATLVDDAAVIDFYRSARSFYSRLPGRRFNSLGTFRDPTLREYFRDDVAFSDYYSALAGDLVDRDAERNQPQEVTIEEFQVDGTGAARVRVRIRCEHALPLRWWHVDVVREDHWERHDGRWWIVPNAL